MDTLIVTSFVVLMSMAGYWLKALTASGCWMSLLVGLSIAYSFGIEGILVLGGFFVTSTLFSKVRRKEKKDISDYAEKGDQRDGIQVLANGGIPALMALIFLWSGESIFLPAFCIAIAVANSDTWASEVGVLSKGKPFSIRTFRPTEKGESGAISWLGTSFALLGSLFIGLLSTLFFSLEYKELILIVVFGFFGQWLDTFLGGWLQRVNRCSVCGAKTEKAWHHQKRTYKIRGISYLTNDAVNVVSIAASTALFILIQYFDG